MKEASRMSARFLKDIWRVVFLLSLADDSRFSFPAVKDIEDNFDRVSHKIDEHNFLSCQKKGSKEQSGNNETGYNNDRPRDNVVRFEEKKKYLKTIFCNITRFDEFNADLRVH